VCIRESKATFINWAASFLKSFLAQILRVATLKERVSKFGCGTFTMEESSLSLSTEGFKFGVRAIYILAAPAVAWGLSHYKTT
jgi:hypothetical protein